MNQLYLADQGKAAGPYPLDQVEQFLRDGLITSEHPVSVSPEGPWVSLLQWKEEAKKAPSLPPPRASSPLPAPLSVLPPPMPAAGGPSSLSAGGGKFRVVSGTLVGLGHGTNVIDLHVRNSHLNLKDSSIRDYIRIDNQTIPHVLIPDLAEAYLICGTQVELHYATGSVNVLFAIRVDGQLHNYIPTIVKVGSLKNGARNMMILMGSVLCIGFVLIVPLMFAAVAFIGAARINAAFQVPSAEEMRKHLAAYS